jgi:RES domain-containing protein
VRVVYTVASKALGVLEFLAHLTPGSVDLLAAWWWLDLDESRTKIEVVDPGPLPRRWNGVRHAAVTRSIGTRWLIEGRTPVLRVPSVHVPGEWNYLINPVHPDAQVLLASAGGPEEFKVDHRILAAAWIKAPRPRRRRRSGRST